MNLYNNQNQLICDRFYLDQYEATTDLQSNTTKVHYINAPTGLAAIFVKESSGAETMQTNAQANCKSRWFGRMLTILLPK